MELGDKIRKVGEVVWEVDRTYKEGMRVPARIKANPMSLPRCWC